MIKLSTFLIENGFIVKRYTYNRKDGFSWVDGYQTPSTMMDLDNYYIKGDVKIRIGLHEHGKPPTLISPRPRILMYRDGYVFDEQHDDSMNAVLQKYSNEEIFEAMFNKEKVFIIN